MAFNGSYQCTRCGAHKKKDELVAKKVMFQELGVQPKTLRSRTTEWLCVRCAKEDPDFKRPIHDSPGMRARVQIAEPVEAEVAYDNG